MRTAGVDYFVGVSLATFARGQHCYTLWQSVLECVSLLFTRYDTAMPRALQTKLCTHF